MENLSLDILQQLWWIIVSLLGGFFVFLTFVQGGQTLIFMLAKNEVEKSMLINSLGRKWELGFTNLVLFGGALFAAFPLFYSTSFGGAYWVWLAILFCFIIQAVSYEYRKKPNNFLGQKTYELFLLINGTLGTFLLGVALSTFFSGSYFTLTQNNFVIWESEYRGLEALLNPYNYLLGFSLIFLSRITASMYFINNIDSSTIYSRAIRVIKVDMILFLIFFLSFITWIFTKDAFKYNPNSGQVHLQKYGYFLNFIDMPIVGIMFITGVILALISAYNVIERNKKNTIKTMGVAIILTVMSVLLNVGLNNSSFYPSLSNIQQSLTIKNASGSHYTLSTMSYVALLVPFVLAYISYVWYLMDKKQITENEILDKSEEQY